MHRVENIFHNNENPANKHLQYNLDICTPLPILELLSYDLNIYRRRKEKLDGVAPLIENPPLVNSTTMHNRLVRQDRNL